MAKSACIVRRVQQELKVCSETRMVRENGDNEGRNERRIGVIEVSSKAGKMSGWNGRAR